MIFLQSYAGINLAKIDRVLCKILNYVEISSLEISAWLLVSKILRLLAEELFVTDNELIGPISIQGSHVAGPTRDFDFH